MLSGLLFVLDFAFPAWAAIEVAMRRTALLAGGGSAVVWRQAQAGAGSQTPNNETALDTWVYTHQLVAKHHLAKNQQKLT
ncbi:hypothetical protein ACFY89_11475 [Achromobacter spanius]|uniref:hypothetical protein n=1 Tax=Achromobacter spanius TaxID=217203 RepID=UPI0036E25A44